MPKNLSIIVGTQVKILMPSKSLSEIRAARRLLEGVLRSKGCVGMNLSNIKGYLGELIIREELLCGGALEEHLRIEGNQSSVDLVLEGPGFGKRGLPIDVKTSTLKAEEANTPPYWGWALVQGKKVPKPETLYICVALDCGFRPWRYFLIHERKRFHFNLKGGIGQFTNVAAGARILQKPSDLRNVPKRQLSNFKKFERLFRNPKIVRAVKPGGERLNRALKDFK